jgi:hypothetical protein
MHRASTFDPVIAVHVKAMSQKNLLQRNTTRPYIPKGRNMTKIRLVLTAYLRIQEACCSWAGESVRTMIN